MYTYSYNDTCRRRAKKKERNFLTDNSGMYACSTLRGKIGMLGAGDSPSINEHPPRVLFLVEQ